MKKMKVYFSFVLCMAIMLTPFSVLSQNAAVDFKKATRFYLEARELAFDITVKTYTSKEDRTGKIAKAMMRKSDNNYYSRFEQDEMIINGSGTLIADHSVKTFTYYETPAIVEKNSFIKINYDSLSKKCDSITFRKAANGDKIYTIYNSRSSAIVKCEFQFDQQKGFIKRMIYFYPDNDDDFTYDAYKTELEYVPVSGKSESSFFSFSKYIHKSGGKYSVSKAYKNYKLSVIPKMKTR